MYIDMLPVMILIGVLLGRALPVYSSVLPVLVRFGARGVRFVVVGRLGNPRALARHGSKDLEPGVEKKMFTG